LFRRHLHAIDSPTALATLPPHMAHQYIFTMKDLRKVVGNNREILKGIWLSFYPGAEIGVLGSNGSGKSTLLKIMAGVDKDVLGNVMEAVRDTKSLLTRYEEVSAKFAEPDADYEALTDEQSKLQDKIEAVGGWDLERTIEIAMDALRLPPGDADVSKLSGG